MGGHREPNGNWTNDWRDVVTRTIYSPEQPDLLRVWLDQYFDFEALVNHLVDRSRMRFPEIDDELSVSCFIEIIEDKNTYALRPDFLWYRDFVRGK